MEKEGIDTGRFLTVFEVNFSVYEKITSADIVAGVNNNPDSGVLLVSKRVDPNETHPLSQKKVVTKVGSHVNGAIFNSRTVQALLWKDELRDNDAYCWKNENTKTYQYSYEFVEWCKKLDLNKIEQARRDYSQHLINVRRQSKLD